MVHQDSKILLSHFRMNEESKDINRIWNCVWIAVIGEIWKQRFSRMDAWIT